MTDKPSQPTETTGSLPEIWSNLKDRLEPTATGSRYLLTGKKGADNTVSKELLEAHDIALNRPVSLKHFRVQNNDDPSELEAFLEEARLTGSLQHPNIIPVHDLTPSPDGDLFFSLRNVDGESLAELLSKAESPFSLNEGLTIVAKVCDAIAFAHDRGVFHNAIDPGAIIVGKFGEVFVHNWAYASKADASTKDLVTNDLKTLGGMLDTIVQKTVPDKQHIPLSLIAVIRRARQPAGSNYDSVETLRDDIAKFQAGHPSSAEEASPVRQLILFAKRHKLESTALLVTALLMAITAAWFVFRVHNERNRAQLAAGRASQAERERRDASDRKEKDLAELKKLVPRLEKQARENLNNGMPEDALDSTITALKLENDPVLWELKGDIQQLLTDFGGAIASYRKVPQTEDNRPRIRKKISLSKTYKDKAGPDGLADNFYMMFCREMKDSGRRDEANYILNSFQKRQRASIMALDAKVTPLGPLHTIEFSKHPDLRLKTQENAGDLIVQWENPGKRLKNFDLIQSIPMTRLKCAQANGITDLDSLRGKPLTALLLNECRVKDLSPLAGLPLEHVSIYRSEVRSLAPLQNIPLKILVCRNSPIDSLEPIATSKLHHLDLGGSTIGSLEPAASMKLKKLMINGTKVESLNGLNVIALEWVEVSDTAIADLAPLKGAHMAFFKADNTRVSDISPVAGANLKELSIANTRVNRLDGLEVCPLEYVTLHHTGISSLAPLAAIKSLRYLDIANTNIKAMPKNEWKKLQTLKAANSELSDVAPLEKSPLWRVFLQNTAVTDIRPIVNRMLFELHIQGTRVADLSPLASSNLKRLNIANTPVADLKPLATVFLSNLNASGTAIASLEGLEKQPLATLNISNTPVTDLTPLKNVPLKEIRFTPNTITTGLDVLRNCKTLKTINGIPAHSFWKNPSAQR